MSEVEKKTLDPHTQVLLNEIVDLVKDNVGAIMLDNDGYFGEVAIKFAASSPHTIFMGRTYKVLNGHVVKAEE